MSLTRGAAAGSPPLGVEQLAQILAVLLGPGAAGHLARCFLAGEHANARLNGISPSPRLRWVGAVMTRLAEIDRARSVQALLEARDGISELRPEGDLPASAATDWIPISEAAMLLNRTDRSVRALAARGTLHARRSGYRWLVDRDDVLDRAAALCSRDAR